MIIAENPHLINSPKIYNNHPLSINYSHTPFNNESKYVLKITDEYDKFTSSNCTNSEKNIDKSIPTILLTIPCGLSFLCLISLMIYPLIKPLITNKSYWRNFYTHNILFAVS